MVAPPPLQPLSCQHLGCCRPTTFWLHGGGYDAVWESNSVEPPDVHQRHRDAAADDRESCARRLNGSNETVRVAVVAAAASR